MIIDEAVKTKNEGNERFKAEEYAEALSLYRTAISNAESTFEALLRNAGPVDEDQTKTVKTFLISTWSNCAEANLKKGDFDEAFVCCTKALRFNPSHSKSIFRRARTLEGMQRHNDALRDIYTLLDLDPDNSAAKKAVKRICSAIKIQNSSLSGLSEKEIQWRAWQARRGQLNVTDENIGDYVQQVDMPSDAKTLSARTESKSWYKFDDSESKQHWNPEDIGKGLGGKYDRFTWRQTTASAELKILLPSKKKGTDVSVRIEPDKVVVLVDGDLYFEQEFRYKIYIGGTSDTRGSTWSLEENRVVVVHLCKWLRKDVGHCKSAADTWWRTIFTDANEEGFGLTNPPKQYYKTKGQH